MIAARYDQIPFGRYCYAYVPNGKRGFATLEQVREYVTALPADEQTGAHSDLLKVKYCVHWKRMDGGRVECTHLGFRAVLWNSEAETAAREYYRENPGEKRMDMGWLIGDAVKECNLNMEGEDFTMPGPSATA